MISTIDSERDTLTDLVIETVAENKGLFVEDEYDKYNPNLITKNGLKHKVLPF